MPIPVSPMPKLLRSKLNGKREFTPSEVRKNSSDGQAWRHEWKDRSSAEAVTQAMFGLATEFGQDRPFEMSSRIHSPGYVGRQVSGE